MKPYPRFSQVFLKFQQSIAGIGPPIRKPFGEPMNERMVLVVALSATVFPSRFFFPLPLLLSVDMGAQHCNTQLEH